VLDEDFLREWFCAQIGALVDIAPTDVDRAAMLDDLGVESPDVVVLMIELSELMGEAVSATVLWDHPTIDALATFLAAVGRGEATLPEDLLDLDFG